ncbi:ABC-type glycerol-3-phosphate transport system, substrate-binding protein [Butyrivibrio sp. ob235]|uniref:ABC transporter substrate-binding protein n=2 Tax=unclassified Butyrivibrio TaxID=2639466 RepID=UPI0004296797|nr:ABC transporter substrate-binding protein [Butyrivibrio sp. ob235]SEM36655.1 ABC-type glycerol-3-phosphate transport system, substrate-binding protein [Butyrivibrio sp. ob235]
MKKGALFLLSMIICLSTLSGCNKPQEQEGKTVITFQTWNPADYGPDSPIYKIIDSFEKENPDIKVNYVFTEANAYQEHMRVELIDGDGPDVYGISSGSAFDAFRLFEENLTPFCENSWGSEWQDKFLDSCLSRVSDVDGKIYGLPLGQTYAGYMWADVNMLKNYGLKVPTSYKEMQETCSKLRENGQYPLAIGAKDSWMNLDLWMSIAADCGSDALYDAIEGRTTFESEPIIESFRIWQDSFSNGVFQDKAIKMPFYNTVNDMFQREGSAPMIVNGSWAMNMYTVSDEKTRAVFDAEGAEHEAFLIDWNDDGKVSPVTANVDVILCLNPESRQKEAAFRFMSYLVNEGQELLVNRYLEYMPSRADMELNIQGLSEDGKKNLDYIIENGKTNVAGTRGIKYEDLSLAVCDALEDLALSYITPEEAASRIQKVSSSVIR